MLSQARKTYDYTIIDTPSAADGSEVGMIGQFCSGAILVVRLHRTRETAARRAVRLLQVSNVPILGCVLIGRHKTVARMGSGLPSKARSDSTHGAATKPKEGSRS
jgi:Mrp family chromosome partitioning ATPase